MATGGWSPVADAPVELGCGSSVAGIPVALSVSPALRLLVRRSLIITLVFMTPSGFTQSH